MNANIQQAAPGQDASLKDQIEHLIEALPEDHLSLGELLDKLGDEGLLLLSILLTLVFLIPVSIPGVSTVFGAVILLIGVSRLSGRPLWLPQRLRNKQLPVEKLRPALKSGLKWMERMDKISRPHRLSALVDGKAMGVINNLAFILAAVLLMMPFSFVPFSNTMPAVALLLFSVGFIQRDGGAVLLGHLANLATIIYFGVLIAGGGVALQHVFNKFTG
ncbi:MAG: exopolysaccharide biosynthesis protein [Xanthomonadaceae bacterium]|nr:exopolysaccharide biosynthesis protein [Xanthomonadaceae bacterium]